MKTLRQCRFIALIAFVWMSGDVTIEPLQNSVRAAEYQTSVSAVISELDMMNAGNLSPQEEDAARRCGAWSPWTIVRSYCDFRYFCFGAGQRGLFVEETRERQCRNSVQVQTRTRFDRCGCGY